MRWLIPLAVGSGSAAAMVVLMLQTPEAVMSARCAVTAMFGAIVIVFALVLGGSAADAVLTGGPRLRPLVDALPPTARLRLAVGRMAWIWVGGAVGILVAVIVGLFAAAANGSPPSWRALELLPLSLIFVAACAVIGWVCGAVGRSWYVPPILVVGSYGAIAGNIGFARTSVMLFGGSPPAPAYTSVSPTVYLATGGYFLALGVAGFVGLLWWAYRRAAPVLTVLATTSVILVLGSMWLLTTVVTSVDAVNLDNPKDWPCTWVERAGYSSHVCVPPDRPHDVDLLSDLPAIQRSLVDLDPSLGGRQWLPMDHPDYQALVYELPMGTPMPVSEQVESVASQLAYRCLVMASDADDEEGVSDAFAYAETLSGWLQDEVGPGQTDDRPSDVNLAQARAAYEALRACP